MTLLKAADGYYADQRRMSTLEAFRMSVDPGSRGTGIALWDDDTWDDPQDLPVLVASFVPPARLAWMQAAQRVMDDINSVLVGLGGQGLKRLYIEMPQFWGAGNAAAQAVAVRGDLQKLTFSAGMVAAFAWWANAKLRPVEVNEWKGQLPKAKCEQRIKALLPGLRNLEISDHGWDAIGIGLWAKGGF